MIAALRSLCRRLFATDWQEALMREQGTKPYVLFLVEPIALTQTPLGRTAVTHKITVVSNMQEPAFHAYAAEAVAVNARQAMLAADEPMEGEQVH